MKKFSSHVWACVCLAWCLPLQAVAETAVLQCGVAQVSLVSTCRPQAEGAPPHCTQRLSFQSPKAILKTVAYQPVEHEQMDEPFVTRLSCLASARTYVVVAESTNFGNCSTCEWKDVFEASGRYIGSTPSAAWALGFPPKKLSGRWTRALDKQPELSSVDISRHR